MGRVTTIHYTNSNFDKIRFPNVRVVVYDFYSNNFKRFIVNQKVIMES